jgi:hypothetical protein
MKDALDPQRTFGLSPAAIAEQENSAAGVKELSHITAHVVRVVQALHRGTVFDLDNGQVWKQLDSDLADVSTKAGDSVEISRGFLGSYYLETRYLRCHVVRLR